MSVASFAQVNGKCAIASGTIHAAYRIRAHVTTGCANYQEVRQGCGALSTSEVSETSEVESVKLRCFSVRTSIRQPRRPTHWHLIPTSPSATIHQNICSSALTTHWERNRVAADGPVQRAPPPAPVQHACMFGDRRVARARRSNAPAAMGNTTCMHAWPPAPPSHHGQPS